MKYFTDCKTVDALKRTYRKLAKELHPDSPTGNEEAFKTLQSDYDTTFNRLKNIHEGQNGSTYYKETSETPEMFKDVINKIIHITNCTIEVVDSWIWITGDTYYNKDIIKEAGFHYASKKKAWYWHSPEDGTSKRSKSILDSVSRIVLDEII